MEDEDMEGSHSWASPRASLLDLPLNLLAMVASSPCASLTPSQVNSSSYREQAEEMQASLFALSHTSRRLRAYSLPALWGVRHIWTVRELGWLRAMFSDLPYLASLVQEFYFHWNLDDKYKLYADYSRYRRRKFGSMLDMAFKRRDSAWTSRLRNSRPNGPDGADPDPRITSVQEFNNCFAQLVAQLTSLTAFGWLCPVTPMPEAMFAQLKLRKLSKLHVILTLYRDHLTRLPLWELASTLEELVVDFEDAPQQSTTSSLIEHSEQGTEEEVTTYQLPASTPNSTKSHRIQVHENVVKRTIVTAARGKRLKKLELLPTSRQLQTLFALPSLLPYWVSMESFGSVGARMSEYWLAAAASLRPTLAHASLWQPKTQPGNAVATSTRLLTHNDISSLHARFEQDGMPSYMSRQVLHEDNWVEVIWPHLFWLHTNAELAQRVTEAWNGVVARGEADIVKCGCEECTRELDRRAAG